MRKLDHCNIVRLRYFFYSSGEKVCAHPHDLPVSELCLHTQTFTHTPIRTRTHTHTQQWIIDMFQTSWFWSLLYVLVWVFAQSLLRFSLCCCSLAECACLKEISGMKNECSDSIDSIASLLSVEATNDRPPQGHCTVTNIYLLYE